MVKLAQNWLSSAHGWKKTYAIWSSLQNISLNVQRCNLIETLTFIKAISIPNKSKRAK